MVKFLLDSYFIFQVSLAKEEVAVLREIARNITASGKELNLWEVMNAVNVTIR